MQRAEHSHRQGGGGCDFPWDVQSRRQDCLSSSMAETCGVGGRGTGGPTGQSGGSEQPRVYSEAGAAERWAGAGLVSKWCFVNWIHMNRMSLDSYLTPCTVNVGWAVEASRR